MQVPSSAPNQNRPPVVSPFDLRSPQAYEAWRAQKLAAYPCPPSELLVPIADPARLRPAEQQTLLSSLRLYNMVIYGLRDPADTHKETVRTLGWAFGLRDLDRNLCSDADSVTSLEVRETGRPHGYIPYTSHRLRWHTDGYYNDPDHRIRSFILHCVRPAATGGENSLIDPEIAYILTRDTDPELIRALMAPEAMTIPANLEHGEQIRPAQSGPVFEIDPANGRLLMRYTARGRNIVWKDDETTRAAVALLTEIMDSDSPYVIRHRLEAGQGVLSNNVLHSRAAFEDGHEPAQRRLLYRARYYDRIQGT